MFLKFRSIMDGISVMACFQNLKILDAAVHIVFPNISMQ